MSSARLPQHVRDLMTEAERLGLVAKATRNKHIKIWLQGKYSKGCLVVASTPSCSKVFLNARSELRRIALRLNSTGYDPTAEPYPTIANSKRTL